MNKVKQKLQNRISKQSLSILELRRSYPCYTLQQIADIKGLTRERIRQVLKNSSLTTYSSKCQICGNPKPNNRKIYCTKCSVKMRTVYAECTNCHKLFPVSKKLLLKRLNDKVMNKHGRIFCTHKCVGQYQKNNSVIKPEEIKGLRLSRNESQETFAKILGTNQDSVSLWENGIHTPNEHFSTILLDLKKIQEKNANT